MARIEILAGTTGEPIRVIALSRPSMYNAIIYYHPQECSGADRDGKGPDVGEIPSPAGAYRALPHGRAASGLRYMDVNGGTR
jgi:hypothetical protein